MSIVVNLHKIYHRHHILSVHTVQWFQYVHILGQPSPPSIRNYFIFPNWNNNNQVTFAQIRTELSSFAYHRGY